MFSLVVHCMLCNATEYNHYHCVSEDNAAAGGHMQIIGALSSIGSSGGICFGGSSVIGEGGGSW